MPLRPIIGLEPITKNQIGALLNVLGMGALIVNWQDIDMEIGRGILTGNNRCLWTNNGNRIEIDHNRGVTMASQTNFPDPLYAELKERFPEPITHKIMFDLKETLNQIKKEAEDTA